jgi:hypothetical protein
MYSQNINGQKKSLGGSHVFPKHLRGPIKRTMGFPRLHLFMEEKSSTISNSGKMKLVKNKNNLTNQKSNKKRAKTTKVHEK